MSCTFDIFYFWILVSMKPWTFHNFRRDCARVNSLVIGHTGRGPRKLRTPKKDLKKNNLHPLTTVQRVHVIRHLTCMEIFIFKLQRVLHVLSSHPRNHFFVPVNAQFQAPPIASLIIFLSHGCRGCCRTNLYGWKSNIFVECCLWRQRISKKYEKCTTN